MKASDLISDASFIAVPIAVLFFFGWSYLSAYLGLFGVDLSEIEISTSTILIYAFVPLNNFKSFIYIIIFIITILIIYIMHHGIMNRWMLLVTLILIFFLTYIGMILATMLAEDAAKRASQSAWNGERVRSEVAILRRDQDNILEIDYVACLNRRGLVHVFSSPDRALLLCRDVFSPTELGMLYMIAQPDRLVFRRKIRATP